MCNAADPHSAEAEVRLATHLVTRDVSEPGDITYLTFGHHARDDRPTPTGSRAAGWRESVYVRFMA